MSKYLLMPLLVVLGTLGVLTPFPTHAGPQEDYLQIYLLIQEAEKLESDGQAASACARYDEAQKRLQQLPEGWEEGIVKYRIKYCRDKITKLKDAKDSNPGATPPPAPTPAPAPNASTRETPPSKPADIAPPSSDEINKLKDEIGRLKMELTQTKQQLNHALDEAKDLRAKLESAQQQLAAAKSQNTEQKMADLLSENASLKEKLTKAEAQVKTLQTGGADGETSVPMLQAQLKKVQGLLASQQQANAAFEQTTNELKLQLEAAQKSLAEARQQIASAQNPDAYRRENEILRGIINRQLQEQARRDVAKKVAQEQLDSLKINSEVLRQQIDILGSPVVALSEEERALLIKPNADLNQGAALTAQLTPPAPAKTVTATTSTPTPAAPTPAPAPSAPAATPAPTVATTPEATATATASTPPSMPPPITPPNASEQFTNPASSTATAASGEPDDFRSKPRIPNDIRHLAQQASDLFAQKRYDEAAAVYQKMIDKYPESLYAWSNLGVVRFQQQNFPEAQKALQQAVKLSPTDAFSHSILGIVYYSLGKYDDAVSTLTRAKALEPNDAKTHNYLGIACSQKGWQEAAEQELRKAIEIDPNYGDAHFNLAVIYATQKPPAKELARRHYKLAQDLGIPKDPQLEKLLQ